MFESDTIEDLADLYDNAPCGYISLSPNARIVKINRTMADWLQYSPDSLLGRPIHDILGFGGKIAYETHLAPILRMHGSVNEIALDIQDAEKVKVPVIANAAERRGDDGQLLFTRLTMFKAVDRMSFERSLIEAKVKADEQAKVQNQAIEIRDQFVAVLGHDLRNPLAAVAAGTRMLARADNLDPLQQTIISEMDGSLKRANKLIDNVLDLARGKLGGGFVLDYKEDQSLDPVLTQIISEIRSIAGNREIVAHLDVGDPVDCDPDRLGQLVSNLLANAVSHGAVDHPIVLAARTTQGQLTISVANGGEQIPKSARKRLFEPFAREHTANTKEGLGLGLFIVDEIAKAHGGAMSVISNKEETKFTLRMPRKKRSAGGSEG